MEASFFSFALTLFLLNIPSLILSTPFSNITTDQNALLAFKNTITSNFNGVFTNNWTTNTPMCNWIGVSCSPKHHRVTALNVSGFGLSGTIAPHLGNLSFLQALDISNNNFAGSIPSELSNLRYLEKINLAGNQITGSIPNGMFNMPSLIRMNMKSNRLSGELPNDICSNVTASKLKIIYLAGNQFYGEIPKNMYKCRELEVLRLDQNRFSGNIPSEIGSLTMLWNLDLSSNNLSGSIPASIFNISSMRIMFLSDNNLSGSFPTDALYNLPEIEELYITGNSLTGGVPKRFGNFTSLKWLEFASNRLTGELPQELGNLIYLEVFAAAYNRLNGSIPSPIFNITTLNTLALQQNLFSGTLPATMGLSLFNLQKLILHFNQLTGDIPTSIINASKLTILELNKNFFTGIIPNFGNLRLLHALRLWENNLTGSESPTQEMEFLSSLTSCQYLEFLEVSDNPLNGVLPSSVGNLSSTLVQFKAMRSNIYGRIPSEIGNLTGLQGLYLFSNHLVGFIPTTIGKLDQLVEVYLCYNRLQGWIPHGVCRMSKLETLDLSFNMLTGPIHECLGEIRTLRTVSFSSNKLNSTIPSKFWELSDLVTLDLSSNNLTGQLSSQIGSWKINYLDFSSNQFTGEIPSAIGNCLSLESLFLSSNKFRGAIPESLGNARGLISLDLSNNNLSGLIPKSLQELHGLMYFNVSFNKLEGEIPNGGCFANFNASSFVHNFDLCGVRRFGVPSCEKNHGRSRSERLVLILKCIFPSIVVIFLVVVVLVLMWKCKQKKSSHLGNISLKKFAWRRVTYVELVRGTNSFSETNLLGRGTFGSVFKATLSDELNVAVKVFNLELEGATKSFETECEILSSIRHRNIVPIIGCCTNMEFKALILEYMPNGSLEKWLHFDNCCLDLMQTLEIAIDTALALEYLHHGLTFSVVHCDIKPSNVLLDEDMVGHVGDFGISKLFDEGEAMAQTRTIATIGYAAPEYGANGTISTNGDVYSYGTLLLEMFTRKKPTDDMFNEEMSLKEWVSESLQENSTSKVAAPGLLSTEDQLFSAYELCVSSIFSLAMQCLAFSPNERINMIQVVATLRKIKARVTTAAMVNNRRGRL